MAREPRPSIEERLHRETYRFDFYKAVKLLESLHPEAVPVGEGSVPDREPVRFQANTHSAFPASDVEALLPPDAEHARPTLQVNFLGLAGAHGPLPPHYTELLTERVWRGDTALRDFLDIFNHRLISLLYRNRQKHRIALEGTAPWHSRFARFLFSLIGLGTPGLRYRMHVEDHALLFYAGLLVHQPRSLPALEAMLQDYFQVPVAGVAFVGQWLELPEEEYTRLGARRGQNQVLGVSAALGTRVWDQQSRFTLRLGPLSLREFLNFLPTGWGFVPLFELSKFFSGPELDFDFLLRLKAAEVPACSLGGNHRLGWSTWLKTREFAQDAEVHLLPKRLYEKQPPLQSALFSHLPQKELEEVLDKMKVHHLPAHSVVVKQGDSGDSLFLIAVGAVQVVRRGLDDAQKILATLEAGDFFGEFSLLSGKPRSATVITVTDSKILELNKPDLDKIMEKHPRVEQLIRAFYARRSGQGGET